MMQPYNSVTINRSDTMVKGVFIAASARISRVWLRPGRIGRALFLFMDNRLTLVRLRLSLALIKEEC